MDIVYVKDFQVDAVIGIYEWERRIKQQVSVDLDMAWNNKPAAESDDIIHTLNYKSAAQVVKEIIMTKQFELVETLAETIANELMKKFNIPWIKVRVGKPFAVTNSAEVGVIIERGDKPE